LDYAVSYQTTKLNRPATGRKQILEMCVITKEVNRLHHRHGVPPAANPTLRAFAAAWLLHKGVLSISTITQAAIVTGSSRPSIESALTLLKAEDQWLIGSVLAGQISLANAAAKVRRRAAAELFDNVVLPSL
jgi:hypothetical protein